MRKKSLLIMALMLLVGAMGARAAEAYAYFDSSDGSLNFCYDNSKSNRSKSGYTVYSLNTGSNLPGWTDINSKVKELYFYSEFANYYPTSCYGWGYYMENLTKVTNINRLNTSKVTNMALMFCHCKSLTSLDVSGFNTANVTSMKSMFESCSKLTSLSVGAGPHPRSLTSAEYSTDAPDLPALMSAIGTHRVRQLSAICLPTVRLSPAST